MLYDDANAAGFQGHLAHTQHKAVARSVQELREQNASLAAMLDAQHGLYVEQKGETMRMLERIQMLERESSAHNRELFDTQSQILVMNGRISLFESNSALYNASVQKLDSVSSTVNRLQDSLERLKTAAEVSAEQHLEQRAEDMDAVSKAVASQRSLETTFKEALDDLRRSCESRYGTCRQTIAASNGDVTLALEQLEEKLSQAVANSGAAAEDLRDTLGRATRRLEDMINEQVGGVSRETAAMCEASRALLDAQYEEVQHKLQGMQASREDESERTRAVLQTSEADVAKMGAGLRDEIGQAASAQSIALNKCFEELSSKLGALWEELARTSKAQYKFQNAYCDSLLAKSKSTSKKLDCEGEFTLPQVPGISGRLGNRASATMERSGFLLPLPVDAELGA